MRRRVVASVCACVRSCAFVRSRACVRVRGGVTARAAGRRIASDAILSTRARRCVTVRVPSDCEFGLIDSVTIGARGDAAYRYRCTWYVYAHVYICVALARRSIEHAINQSINQSIVNQSISHTQEKVPVLFATTPTARRHDAGRPAII